MKKNMAKFITSTVMASILVSSVPIQIFAMDNESGSTVNAVAEQSVDEENEISPATVSVTRSYSIDKVGKSKTVQEGSWKLLYDGSGAPCRRDGETVSAGSSVTYSHSYSGTLLFPLKAGIQAQVGYTFGDDKTFQAYKTSAPLKVGQYVKAYYKKTYEVTPITQKEYITTKGYETVNGVTRPVDKTEVKTYNVDCKEAILPVIDLKYFPVGTRAGNGEDTPVASEVYEFKNGEYVLVSRTEY